MERNTTAQMDPWQFDGSFLGQGNDRLPSGERARYRVADALTAYATQLQWAGRPDRAGLLRSIAGEIRVGGIPSKRSVGKAAREIAVVRARLCGDGA